MRTWDDAKRKTQVAAIRALGFTEITPKFMGGELFMVEVVRPPTEANPFGDRFGYTFIEGETESDLLARIIKEQGG